MPNIAYLDLKYDRRSTVTNLYDDPFTITALTNNCTINISNISDDTDITFKMSYDNGMTYEDVTIEAQDTFSFTISTVGYSVPLVKTEAGHWMSNIRIDSDEGDEFSVSGNIMTLIDASQNITSVPAYYFYSLFNDADGLVDASELRLPATEVGQSSYANMFDGCSNLKKGPAILPATTLDNYCYGYMFGECSSLIAAPSLPATTLAEGCYNMMFWSCGSLMISPELPATTLAYYCYHGMFGYSGLSSAPVLPATTLADNCYEEMFIGCGALVTAPALPATTLAEYCYKSMFEGCTSLTAAPNLIAENMVKECYKKMFYNCENLNFIRILAKDTATDYITDWVHNVAPFGVFIKDPDTNYTIDSDSGVPIGWTIANEGEDIPVYYGVTVLVDPAGGGTVTGNRTYLKDDTATVTATSNSEYDFVGWYNEDNVLLSENTSYSFEVTRYITLTAKFVVNTYYTVTLNSDDPELDPTLTGAGTYAAHDIVTITASNVTDYNFIGWMENEQFVSYNQTWSFELTRNITLSAVYEEILDYPHEYLTIEVLKNNCKIELCISDKITNGSIDIKINSGEWHTYNFDDMYAYGSQFGGYYRLKICEYTHMDDADYELVFNRRDRIHFRRLRKETTSGSSTFAIAPDKDYKVYGNIACLNENHDDLTNMTDSYYSGINLDTMYRGSNEVSTVLNECYQMLFANLGTSLVPVLTSYLSDAKNLILPFTTLNEFAYSGMFSRCVLLPSDKLPVLNAVTLAQYCYENMFSDCTSLVTAPALPVTTLKHRCYSGMFSGCTSLVTAPELPATTLANDCYSSMFSGCTSLVTAPVLPATTLAYGCYYGMFSGCRSLVNAPVLPATTPTYDSYSRMFAYCSSLKQIKCLATGSTDGSGHNPGTPRYATIEWVVGVPNSDTESSSSARIFIKAANYNGWSTGDNGIPLGWTVQDYTS